MGRGGQAGQAGQAAGVPWVLGFGAQAWRVLTRREQGLGVRRSCPVSRVASGAGQAARSRPQGVPSF